MKESLQGHSALLEKIISPKHLAEERVNSPSYCTSLTHRKSVLFIYMLGMAKVRQEDSHIDSASFAASGLLLCCLFHYYKSFCHTGEGDDQLTQHRSAGCGGRYFAGKLLGIPALQNCTSVSTKEHQSQLKFIRHICRSKRINSCETDHSLSRLLNPH